MKDQTPVLVARDQDEMKDRVTHQFKYGTRGLSDAIRGFNVPANPAQVHIPVDLMWTCDGRNVAGDIKTGPDFIASYQDGRLHNQIKAMQDLDCVLQFIFLEGPLSTDGGYTVGDRQHGWDWKQFENAKLRIQLERHPAPSATPQTTR
jgi:hypothetical protein